jgi:hypothetical protein
MSMLPYNVEVTMKDGEPHEYEVSMGALIAWEDFHTDMTFRDWQLKQTWKGLAYLGYACIKDTGATLKPFKEWAPTVREIRLVPKDET